MNEIEEVKIENMIYEIRGKHIMLDSDLAKLYQCKNGTKVINQAVKRNINRFPEDFCFQISEIEYKSILRSQSVTLELKQGKYSKYLPYAFTEEGVAMLASIIRTPIAEEISVKIMRTFVIMRKYISDNLIEQRFINEMVLSHDKDIKLLQESFDKLEGKELKNEIYFEGQIYDSYSKIVDIMSKTRGLLNKLDIEKYNSQYNNLKVIYNDSFHDRYFILDKSMVYHCGTSINHIGSKTFSINKIEEDIVINSLMHKVNELNR